MLHTLVVNDSYRPTPSVTVGLSLVRSFVDRFGYIEKGEVYTQIKGPYYGSIEEANSYFSTRLHTQAWTHATPEEQLAALYMATRAIEMLNFKGHKANKNQILFFPRTVDTIPPFHSRGCFCYSCCPLNWVTTYSNLTTGCNPFGFPPVCPEPRPDPSLPHVVPGDIEVAAYECALAFLNGIDMDVETRNFGVESQGYAGARTTYNRTYIQEHLRAGIPSATAWSILRPYLADPQALKLVRTV